MEVAAWALGVLRAAFVHLFYSRWLIARMFYLYVLNRCRERMCDRGREHMRIFLNRVVGNGYYKIHDFVGQSLRDSYLNANLLLSSVFFSWNKQSHMHRYWG